jgi:hypothetical protein
LLLLGTGNAFAQCHPTIDSYMTGGYSWNVYEQDPACYTVTTGVSSTTVGCFYGGGWSFNDNWPMNVHTEFTLQTGDPIQNPNNWDIGSFIEFNSPSHSAYDWIGISVYVYHPNNTVSSYSIFYWDGTMGSLSGCAQQYGTVTAHTGDTIKIQINSSNGTAGATIKASVPQVTNHS